MSKTKDKWNTIYQQRCVEKQTPSPAQVLADNTHLLPTQGLALDLACGLGGNAFFLANHGLTVDAWDISEVAINNIKQRATATNKPIRPAVIDISAKGFPTDHYNIITVSRFLDRLLIPNIINALKPKGLLFYQTFILDKTTTTGPSSAKFLLKKNELLQLFSELSLVLYREEGVIGNTNEGFRNEAMLVAEKE